MERNQREVKLRVRGVWGGGGVCAFGGEMGGAGGSGRATRARHATPSPPCPPQVAEQDAERARFVVLKAEQERNAAIIRAEGESEAAKLISDATKVRRRACALVCACVWLWV